MYSFRPAPGLRPRVPSPPIPTAEPDVAVTEEAGITPGRGQNLRINPLVKEGDLVAQGAPLACLRGAPDIQLVAPMPARVAHIQLQPGRKLSEIVLFRETTGDVFRHPTEGAETEPGLRRLMQRAGLWPWIQRRPFGGMPDVGERPAAIVVMAADTRPLAPDPQQAISGRRDALARGLAALVRLTAGPVLVCAPPNSPVVAAGERIRQVTCGEYHPQGAAGIRIHAAVPATIETPIWEVHAEDVAALGDLLSTGVLAQSRLVSITGAALKQARLVRTQPGADLRGLTQRHLKPGQNRMLSGSVIDGGSAHWLAPRDRQVSALPVRPHHTPRHWLFAALTRSAGPRPIIPTAALDHAFGGALPASPFVRALSAGDMEAAMRLGILSLLEEDVAMADYVLGGGANLAGLLRAMLEDIRQEFAA